MELVYLWVEEYRNIKEEEFYFTNNELLSEDLNLTAIVGGNGSGKSSFIEVLLLVLNSQEEKFQKFCLVYIEDGEQKLYYGLDINSERIDTIKEKYKIDTSNNIKPRVIPKVIHQNYSLDRFSQDFDNLTFSHGIYNYESPSNIYSLPNKRNDDILLDELDIKTQKDMITILPNNQELIRKILDEVFGNSNANFLVKYCKLHLNVDVFLNEINERYLNEFLEIYIENNKVNTIKDLSRLSKLFFIAKVYSLRDQEQNRIDYSKFNNALVYLEGILTEFKEYSSSMPIDENHNDIIESLDNTINELDNSDYLDSLNNSRRAYIRPLIKIVEYIRYVDTIKTDMKLFKNKEKVNHNLLNELLPILPSFIEVEFWNEKNISYKDLSYGEKIVCRLLYTFYNIITEDKPYIIVFDEIENGLHPEWQKKFVNYLVQMLDTLPTLPNRKIHIFLSTHSPFILSDFSQENIIFLEKSKNRNCINKTKDIRISSFGANIHTLLSHGFFMKDGLMGEFAKSKIDKAIEYLNQKVLTKEEIDYCENIISIIGEPILKNTLKSMYDEKVYLKESKLDRLKRKQKEIEKEIEIEKEMKVN